MLSDFSLLFLIFRTQNIRNRIERWNIRIFKVSLCIKKRTSKGENNKK